MSTTPEKKSPLQEAIDTYLHIETLPNAKGLGAQYLAKAVRTNITSDAVAFKDLEQIPLQFFKDNNLFVPSLAIGDPQQTIREAKAFPPLLAAVTPALRDLVDTKKMGSAEMTRSKDGFSQELGLDKEKADTFATKLSEKYPLLPALLVCKEKSFVMPMLLAGNTTGLHGKKLSEDILDLAKIAKDTQRFFQDHKADIEHGWEGFSVKHERELSELESRFAKAIESQAKSTSSLIPQITRERILKGIKAFTKTREAVSEITPPKGLPAPAVELAANAGAAFVSTKMRERATQITNSKVHVLGAGL